MGNSPTEKRKVRKHCDIPSDKGNYSKKYLSIEVNILTCREIVPSLRGR
jgi:hypothetical protein